MSPLEISVIIVSFNTRDLLRDCLLDAMRALKGFRHEIIVVDNDSHDGSVSMVEQEFPQVELIKGKVNLGFAGANNLAYHKERGEFILLLNSDAFIKEDGLSKAMAKMKTHRDIGLLGAKLVGEKGEWQPSARTFPSVRNDFFIYSGLSARHPESPVFGKPDLTYLSQEEDIYCDWVPGAFALIRKEALGETIFDERFFLYSEEVDLCLRLRRQGWKILYTPEVEVLHIGGSSTKTLKDSLISQTGKQLVLWKYQSQYLYYRKNFGYWKTFLSLNVQRLWNGLHALKNWKKEKGKASSELNKILKQAWENTRGGTSSPSRPWSN